MFPSGPWDSESSPQTDDPMMVRLDLGGLKVPLWPDMELRIESNDEDQIIAVVVNFRGSSLQMGSYAAPRSEGIWAQARHDICAGITSTGGTAQVVHGPWGEEIHARIRDDKEFSPARFIAVDGPRWLMRGILTGDAATNDEAADPLLKVFAHTIVVRGVNPLPVGVLIPLHLPAQTPTTT